MKKELLDDDLPPFLREMKEKGDGFKVPEAYFEGLEDAVFKRLEAGGDMRRPAIKATKRPLRFPLSIRPRTAMALAAGMALVLAAVWFFQQPAAPPQQQIAAVELTEEDLESYLLDNVHEFDPEQLATLNTSEITETSSENNNDSPQKNQPAANDIHPDDLDHILDEMTDEELEQIL